MLKADPREVARALELLTEPGGVFEIRVPKTQHEGTISGYFDAAPPAVKAIAGLNGHGPGVYLLLNPARPALIARAANRLKSRVSVTTSDADVIERRWLLVDCDAVRPAGISSSDEEHEAALERCRIIRWDLSELGWSQPVLADSGNGGHLLYRIALANDAEAELLIQRDLKALALRYDDDVVRVDQTVYNAGRISKVYGTVAAKGDDIADRPHRLSRILDVPATIEIVTRKLLEELAATIKEPDPPRPGASAGKGQFAVQAFIARHLKARSPVAHEGGRKWTLEVCPFNSEHKAPDAAVFERADGSLGFKCFHNSCAGMTWRHVRELFEGPGPNRQSRPASEQRTGPRVEDDWPDPELLQDELLPVMPFDAEMLPDVFRPWVEDVSQRMQVPLDFPAVGATVAIAGAVNRRASVRPKLLDAGWVIVLNLWGGLVALPGLLKSPTLKAMTALLYAIEALWREEHQHELDEYELEKEAAELRMAAWKDQARANFRKGATPPLRPDISVRPPTQKRLIVGDATFEKLHEIMAENPAGLLVVRDELSGWMSQQDRPGREGERAFSLECWNGDTGHTIDRIGRGSVYVPACCTSMLGGITPGRLRSYLTDALEDRPGNDGLLQRFQLLVWPDCPSEWVYTDRPPDAVAEQQVKRIFQALATLDPDTPIRLRFDPEAQELFEAWLAELEHKIRGGDLHPALVAHLSKYRRLMPALAGLFELAEGAARKQFGETIGLRQAQRGAAWCDYLESHARRIYACAVSPQMRAARDLAAKIRQRKIGASGVFSCRETYFKGWTGLSTPEAVRQAAEILEDAHWIRRLANQQSSVGGRPSDRYAVNPRVYL